MSAFREKTGRYPDLPIGRRALDSLSLRERGRVRENLSTTPITPALS